MTKPEKKEKKKRDPKEGKLQSTMVLHFSQTYPERYGDLFGTFHETTSAAQGSNMLSKGLIPGVSDLIYISTLKHLIGIEVKFPGTYHDTIHVLEQCRFLIENSHHGWFCTDLDQFKEIIHTDGKWGGIDPDDVLEMCKEKMQPKIELSGNESIDDLIFACNKYEKKSGKKVARVRF